MSKEKDIKTRFIESLISLMTIILFFTFFKYIKFDGILKWVIIGFTVVWLVVFVSYWREKLKERRKN